MTTTSIADLLYDIDALTDKLNDTKIYDKLEESRDAMDQVKTLAETHILEVEQYNKELQEQLDVLTAKTEKLSDEYNETVQLNNQHKEETLKQKKSIEEEAKKCKALDAEIQELEKALHALNEEPAVTSENPMQLQLALYRGMGIHIRVEDDKTVKKAILTSPNYEDIITFPIVDYSTDFTANHIWDFVSKGL